MTFSMIEMQAILIDLLEEFEFSPPPGNVEIIRAATGVTSAMCVFIKNNLQRPPDTAWFHAGLKARDARSCPLPLRQWRDEELDRRGISSMCKIYGSVSSKCHSNPRSTSFFVSSFCRPDPLFPPSWRNKCQIYHLTVCPIRPGRSSDSPGNPGVVRFPPASEYMQNIDKRARFLSHRVRQEGTELPEAAADVNQQAWRACELQRMVLRRQRRCRRPGGGTTEQESSHDSAVKSQRAQCGHQFIESQLGLIFV
jgi:hypothetical protein